MPLKPLSSPKTLSKRFFGWLRVTSAAVFFLPTLMVGNAVQMLSLVVRPFSQKAFRAINRFGANMWWSWCVLWAELVHRTKIRFSGDELPVRENAILVSNHQEMVDIPVLFSLAYAKRRLGDMKWFAKDIIKYVPGFGWGLLFLDCLFVKRNWTADKDKIDHVFSKILKHRVPLWLITFTEGTRLKMEKLHRSVQYAKERGLRPPRHVMLPRTKGFVASVQALRGHVDAVYDVTIGYVGGVPTIWQWVKGQVKQANVHVRRFAVKDLPEEAEALSQWLIDRFQEKDRLLDYYYRHGAFPPALNQSPAKSV